MAATTNLRTTPQEPISASALTTRSLLGRPVTSGVSTPTPSDFPSSPSTSSTSPTSTSTSTATTTTRMSAAEHALTDNDPYHPASTSSATPPSDPKSILSTSTTHPLPTRPTPQHQPSTNYITALAAAAQASLNSTPSTPGADLPIARAKPKGGAGAQDENSVEKGEGLIQGMRPFLDRQQSWRRQDARRDAQRALMADVAGEGDFGYESARGRAR